MRGPVEQLPQRGIQIAGQFHVVRVRRTGLRPYDNQATGGQQRQPVPQQMPQPSLHTVTDHRVADGLAHDETRTRRGDLSPRRVRVRSTA